MLRSRIGTEWIDPEMSPNALGMYPCFAPFILEVAMYVSRTFVMNEMPAPREETRGLPLPQLCFYIYFNSGTTPLVLCRISLSRILEFKYYMLCFVNLVTRLSNTQRGRQEQRSQHLVHKKMGSGTRHKVIRCLLSFP